MQEYESRARRESPAAGRVRPTHRQRRAEDASPGCQTVPISCDRGTHWPSGHGSSGCLSLISCVTQPSSGPNPPGRLTETFAGETPATPAPPTVACPAGPQPCRPAGHETPGMPFPDFVCHTAPSGPNPPGRLTETFAGVTPEMVTPIWFSETSTSIVCFWRRRFARMRLLRLPDAGPNAS